jgi:Fe-S-cluster containining protein
MVLMGKCIRCGMCCRAICLKYSKKEMKRADYSEERAFILKNWKSISRKKALEINPYLGSLIEEYIKGKVKLYWYTCKFLKDDNTCSDYENRLPICRGYPWYGLDPKGQEFLYGEHCGYKVDLLTRVESKD